MLQKRQHFLPFEVEQLSSAAVSSEAFCLKKKVIFIFLIALETFSQIRQKQNITPKQDGKIFLFQYVNFAIAVHKNEC